MNIAVSLETTLILELMDSLKKKGLGNLREKILLSLPDNSFKTGSSLWWEQGTLKAKNEIKKGNSLSFKNTEEAIKHLDSLSA